MKGKGRGARKGKEGVGVKRVTGSGNGGGVREGSGNGNGGGVREGSDEVGMGKG